MNQEPATPTHGTLSSNTAFISHNYHDAQFCIRLAKDLRAAGFTVWISEDSKSLADPIPTGVSLALANARNFVLLASKHSVESQWVSQELATALHRQLSLHNMRVFVAVLEKLDPWPDQWVLLSPLPFIQFDNQPYEKALSELLSGLREQQSASDASETVSENVTSSELTRYKSHMGPALCVQFSHDGLYVASGGADGAIALWDIEARRQIVTLQPKTLAADWIRALAWSPDDRHLLAAYDHQGALIWNIETRAVTSKLSYPMSDLLDLAWTDAGISCALRSGWVGQSTPALDAASSTLDWDTTLQLPRTRTAIAQWHPQQFALALAPQGTQVLCGDPRNDLLPLASVAWSSQQSSLVHALQWSHDGSRLGALYESGRVVIWDANHGSITHDWETNQKSPRGLYWSRHGNMLVISDTSGAVKQWSISSQQLAGEYHVQITSIQHVATHPTACKFCLALSTGELCFADFASDNS